MHSLSGAVNTILGDNCTSLHSRGSVHSSGTSPSLHQAVTWSLSSPFYNDVIHLTGVYIFPNEGKLEEFFHTLTAHSNHPFHEPHIYAGDFNAYTAEEIEKHITPLDSHALFHRVGDTTERDPAHSPSSPLTQRGFERALLDKDGVTKHGPPKGGSVDRGWEEKERN